MGTGLVGGGRTVRATGVDESGLSDGQLNSQRELEDSDAGIEDLLDLITEVNAGEVDHKQKAIDEHSRTSHQHCEP
jgi:hypothetical protein